MKQLLFFLMVYTTIQAESYSERGRTVTLSPIAPPSNRAAATPEARYYRTNTGRIVAAKRGIILRLHNAADLASILTEYSLTHRETIADNYYHCEVVHVDSLFSVVNQLHQDSRTLYAQPNLQRERDRR